MKKLLQNLVSFSLFITISVNTNAQISQMGNGFPGVATDYVGWNATRLFPLTIQHQGNFPIVLNTNGTQRMFIANGTANQGFVGIGSGFNAPVSLLHINSFNNGTGEVFRTTAPVGVDHTWRMNATEFDAFRFFIQNPANTVEARLVNEVNGEINFFTNFAGSGGARSVSFQNGVGDVVHGEVAMGNRLPVGFNAQNRLHLHQSAIGGVVAANYVQFTNTTFNTDAPAGTVGVRVGQNQDGRAIFQQWDPNQPMQFYTGPWLALGNWGTVRLHINSRFGLPDEGFVGINNNAPTSRLDIAGNLRIRDVQEVPADALLLGLRHNPAIGQDLDVRRLDFNNDSMTYLGGNGTWVNLPSPTGIVPENGLSFQTGSTTNVEFGQDVNALNDPAALQNHREVPMNDFNVTFIDDGSTNGNYNRIGIGYEFPVARLDVRTHPTSHGSPTALRLVNSTTASDSLGYGTRILVDGTNNTNLGIDLEVLNASSYNTGVRVNVETPVINLPIAWNIGGGFAARNGRQNYGVGGGAFSAEPFLYATNFGVQGYAEGNYNNIGGEFKAFSSNVGTDYSTNTGVSGAAWGNAVVNVGVEGIAVGQNTSSLNHVGGKFRAQNGIDNNIGIYALADGTGAINYAGYFSGDVFIAGPNTAAGLALTSDQQFKTDIDDLSNAMDIINSLQARTFYYDTVGYERMNFSGEKQYGFVAQEVETFLPELVAEKMLPVEYDSLGNVTLPALSFKTLNYNAFIGILTAGMQEQQAVIEAQQAELNEKDSIIDAIINRLDLIEQCLNNSGICNTNFHAPHQNSQEEQQRAANSIDVQLRNGESIVLDQNVPNPFAEKTVITYFIPESIGKAQIHFYNNEGKLINSVEIRERGNGQINVFADDLSSGVYTYSLIADGKFIATKRMVKE